MLRKRQAQAFGEALHGARLVIGDDKAAVMIPGRALQELGEGPGLGGHPLQAEGQGVRGSGAMAGWGLGPRSWVRSWSPPSTPGPRTRGHGASCRPAPQICRPWQTVPRAWSCGHPRVLKGFVCVWSTGLGTTRSPHPGPLSCATRPAPQDPWHPNGAPRGPSTAVPRFPCPPPPMCHSEIGVSRPLTQAPWTRRGRAPSFTSPSP